MAQRYEVKQRRLGKFRCSIYSDNFKSDKEFIIIDVRIINRDVVSTFSFFSVVCFFFFFFLLSKCCSSLTIQLFVSQSILLYSNVQLVINLFNNNYQAGKVNDRRKSDRWNATKIIASCFVLNQDDEFTFCRRESEPLIL